MKRNIYELIEKIIDKKVKGADTYINNDSRWLIFTDEKKWIFELTKEGTLWYNFYFFQGIFKLISLDVVDNQHHITKWVENFIRNGVKETKHNPFEDGLAMEEAIQNGVKETWHGIRGAVREVEDTIQNGVKNTQAGNGFIDFEVEDTIQNGVKEIKEVSDDSLWSENFKVNRKKTIRDGVKRTELGGKDRKIDEIKDIVENGIKETNLEEHHRLREVVQTVKNGIKETTPGGYLGSVEMKGKTVHQFEHSKQDNVVENVIESGIKATESIASHRTWMSEQVINNGIKETVCGVLQTYNPMNFEPVTKEMKRMNEVNIVLEKGIKEVKELPDKSGELNGYGEYYARQKNRTYPHNDIVNDVIRDGIKETKTPNDQNFVDTLDFLDYNGSTSVPNIIDQVIENGINQTNWRKVDNHPTFVDRIIEKST